MPNATVPCALCGAQVNAHPLAQYSHAAKHRREAFRQRVTPPPCDCTVTHRCPAALQLHADWQRGHRVPGLLGEYGRHLRAAGVAPGQARWEGVE